MEAHIACIHTPEWCPGLDSMNYTLSRLFTPVTWCEGRGAVTDRFGRHPQMWPPVNCEYLLEASIIHGDVTRPTALSGCSVRRRAVTPAWRGRQDFEALCVPLPLRPTQVLPGTRTILRHREHLFAPPPLVTQVTLEVTCDMESRLHRSSSRRDGAIHVASGCSESLAGCRQP